jgi:hypothetical protein
LKPHTCPTTIEATGGSNHESPIGEATTQQSSLIREELAQSPNATAAEIAKALSAKRDKVTPGHVYNAKATSGKRKGRKARANNGDALDVLIKAKKMADAMGGVDNARAALDALAKLL